MTVSVYRIVIIIIHDTLRCAVADPGFGIGAREPINLAKIYQTPNTLKQILPSAFSDTETGRFGENHIFLDFMVFFSRKFRIISMQGSGGSRIFQMVEVPTFKGCQPIIWPF